MNHIWVKRTVDREDYNTAEYDFFECSQCGMKMIKAHSGPSKGSVYYFDYDALHGDPNILYMSCGDAIMKSVLE